MDQDITFPLLLRLLINQGAPLDLKELLNSVYLNATDARSCFFTHFMFSVTLYLQEA